MFSPPLYEIWEGYDFYTPCTKDTIAQWYASLCQGRDVLPATAKQRVAELKKNNPKQTAVLQGILDWVTKDIRYVSVAFGASSHQPRAVTDTLANLYGDCKDQSLLVKSLCREAGIPAALVILDAFGEPCDENSQAIERFNHCIVEAVADGKSYFLDPAAGHAKLGHISPLYAGTKALKLDGMTGSIVTLPPYEPLSDEESSQTIVKLNPNGSAVVTERTYLTGERASQMKEQMKSAQPEKVRKYLEDSYKKTGRKLLDFFMTAPDATGDDYESRLSYTVPRFGSMTAGGLVFNLGGQSRREDPLAALNQPRTEPFRFRATDPSKVAFIVELPVGAVLKSQPEDVDINTPFMKATRKLSFKDNKLSITESSQLLDARVDANAGGKIYAAFRKLQDHREYAFIVEMPNQESAQN
jgi:transglutaminase-like putative cysteine protease